MPLGFKSVTQSQLYVFADQGRLHNIAPVLGTPSTLDGASVGWGYRLGWLSNPGTYTADVSVAKGVSGVHKQWRFFFILAGRF